VPFDEGDQAATVVPDQQVASQFPATTRSATWAGRSAMLRRFKSVCAHPPTANNLQLRINCDKVD